MVTYKQVNKIVICPKEIIVNKRSWRKVEGSSAWKTKHGQFVEDEMWK